MTGKSLSVLSTTKGQNKQRAFVLRYLVTLAAFIAPFQDARAGDGRLDWRTLKTAHFRIHYPAHLSALAQSAAIHCEDAHRQIGALFNHAPEQIVDVSLTDFGDDANGSATAIPSPRMVLFAAPPRLDSTLGNFDDWFKLLIYHEYTHILQLDQVAGFPALLNLIFGRVFVPNQNLPSFQLEGGAVWAESLLTGHGRIHSALFHGFLLAQARAGHLHSLSRMTHTPPDWPDANIWYMYGGHFVQWITDRFGHQWMAKLHREIADDLLPFAINRATKAGTGVTLAHLFERWINALSNRAIAKENRLLATGAAKPEQLTYNGRNKRNLRFGPDSALYTLESGHQEPAIIARHIDKAKARVVSAKTVLHADGLQDFTVCHDGQLPYVRRMVYEGAYSFSDLFVIRKLWQPPVRLTRGARIREIECHPNARSVIAVQLVNGHTRLIRIDLSAGAVTVLYTPPADAQVGLPQFSPSGEKIVFSMVGATTGRDLFIVDQDGRNLLRLTDDEHLELNASFTKDGRSVRYVSDRDGTQNLYRIDIQSRALHRLSDVFSGISDFTGGPSGDPLVVSVITEQGYDLAIFRPKHPEIVVSYQPTSKDISGPAERNTITRAPPPKSSPYHGFTYLWPQSWSPIFSFSTLSDLSENVGLEIESSDPLGHHGLAASVNGSPADETMGFSALYAYRRLRPILAVSAARQTKLRPGAAYYNLETQPWRENTTVTGLSLNVPMRLGGVALSASFGYNYAWTRPGENAAATFEPIDKGPVFPAARESASLTSSLAVGNTDAFFDSVSVESGWSARASVRWRRPEFGGDVESAELFGTLRGYLPIIGRHVLALSSRFATGRGDGRTRPTYGFGVPQQRNIILDALDEIYLGDAFVRGFPSGHVVGDRYVLVNAEYRMPVVDLFAGAATLPLFMKRLKLAIFTDWVQADFEPLKVETSVFEKSLGLELVTEAQIGWRLPVSARLGYARGLGQDGEAQLYFFLGRWF